MANKLLLLLFAIRTVRSDGILDAIVSGRGNELLVNTVGTVGSVMSNCLVGRNGWSDPELGDFQADETYCDANCLRNVICCAPEKLEQLGVQFLLNTKKFDNQVIRTGDRNVLSMLTPGPVVFIVHGFLNSYSYETMWNQTKNGWVERGANAILVDWSKANRLYIQSMANVRVVGALIGQLIKSLGVADRSVCAGFSLGSHVCGEAGAWLRKRGQVLARCHGIDPAGPGFDGCGPKLRLDPTDCGLVTSIHSSQFSTDVFGFGTKYKTGHCDFWVNDGLQQPHCGANPSTSELVRNMKNLKMNKLSQDIENLVGCGHVRAMKYYISQLEGKCNFYGEQGVCGNGKECLSYRSGRTMSMSPDDRCAPNLNVDFRVQTSGNLPFCLK